MSGHSDLAIGTRLGVTTFSCMSGIIHPYYTVALAPGIAALVGIGGAVLLRHRSTRTGSDSRPAEALVARIVLAAVTAGMAVWAFVMLGWSTDFLPWLRWTVLVVGVLAGIAFLVPSGRRGWAAAVVGAAVLAGVAAPAAYAAQTAVTYFVNGGGGGPGSDRGVGTQITQWVAEHYTATTVGNRTVYDLSSPAR